LSISDHTYIPNKHKPFKKRKRRRLKPRLNNRRPQQLARNRKKELKSRKLLRWSNKRRADLEPKTHQRSLVPK
jgi:hypothetical protein